MLLVGGLAGAQTMVAGVAATLKLTHKIGHSCQERNTAMCFAYAIALFSVKPTNASSPLPSNSKVEGSGTAEPLSVKAPLNGP